MGSMSSTSREPSNARAEVEAAVVVEHVVADGERRVLRGGDDAEDAATAAAHGEELHVVPAVVGDAHDLTRRGEVAGE